MRETIKERNERIQNIKELIAHPIEKGYTLEEAKAIVYKVEY